MTNENALIDVGVAAALAVSTGILIVILFLKFAIVVAL